MGAVVIFGDRDFDHVLAEYHSCRLYPGADPAYVEDMHWLDEPAYNIHKAKAGARFNPEYNHVGLLQSRWGSRYEGYLRAALRQGADNGDDQQAPVEPQEARAEPQQPPTEGITEVITDIESSQEKSSQETTEEESRAEAMYDAKTPESPTADDLWEAHILELLDGLTAEGEERLTKMIQDEKEKRALAQETTEKSTANVKGNRKVVVTEFGEQSSQESTESSQEIKWRISIRLGLDPDLCADLGDDLGDPVWNVDFLDEEEALAKFTEFTGDPDRLCFPAEAVNAVNDLRDALGNSPDLIANFSLMKVFPTPECIKSVQRSADQLEDLSSEEEEDAEDVADWGCPCCGRDDNPLSCCFYCDEMICTNCWVNNEDEYDDDNTGWCQDCAPAQRMAAAAKKSAAAAGEPPPETTG